MSGAARMRRVTVEREAVRLSCLVGGEAAGGQAVVLLHGLAGSAAELLPVARALPPGRRVIAVDQRGHGHSTRRPADLSRRAYADDAAAVIRELAGGPVLLVGQSMGGHTALLTAAWHPELVSRLVLVESGVGGGEDPGILRWFAGWPVPFPSREAAVTHLGGTPIARAWAADLEDTADGFRPRFDPDVMGAAFTAMIGRACWAEWRRIMAPTLLVRGQQGTIPDAEVAAMLEQRPGTGHVVIPGAGHDVHLDQPAAFLEALRGFG